MNANPRKPFPAECKYCGKNFSIIVPYIRDVQHGLGVVN